MHKLLDGVLWYVAFLFSTTLHEASHAYAALRLGDATAYNGGQVSLDPIPHMRREPIGTIVVPMLSYVLSGWMIGWASVPYNFAWALNHPKRAAGMSIAGPAANLLLVVLAALLIRIGLMFAVLVPPDSVDFTHVVAATEEGVLSTLASFLNVLFSLNLLLFTFNLLPIPPLDGSGIVPLLFNEERGRNYLLLIRNPSLAFMGLIVAWRVFDFLYHPLHLACINLLYYPVAHYE